MVGKKCRKDFPILQQHIQDKPLVYLDSSASSQKPLSVIEAISHYYQQDHANIHRGVYSLSVRATEQFEKTREHMKTFINANHAHEIIFVRGATEGINLVAESFGASHVLPGDEILISAMEHHSNIVPWQMMCEKRGAVLRVIPILDSGELDLDAYQALLSSKTKLVAVTHASNVLGTINPIQAMVSMAHQVGAVFLVDGAQAFPHVFVDVKALDCDFYVMSSHKAYGPTGVGVLYGKTALLEKMPPYQGGGDMIERVSFEKTTYAKLPSKFEAGTPNIADVIGFDAALTYLDSIGMPAIEAHEQGLLKEATELLSSFSDLRMIGTAKEKVGVISFTLGDIHPHDIATILDHEGIAVRAGHHCAMPLMERFNVPATVRASFGVYTTKEDIEALVKGLHSVKRLFG